MRRKHPRLVAGVGAATMALALGAPGTATAGHGGPHAVPIKQAVFSGYATGTYLHTHLLQLGTTRLVNANVAGSAAAVKHNPQDPTGLTQRADETGRFVVNPEAPGKISWGRGVALEAGVLEEVPSGDAAIALAGVAKQAAPPTVGTPDTQSIDLDLDPLLYLSLARGEASANWNSDDPCIYKSPEPPTRFALGPPPKAYEEDFGFGLASVADVELLDLGETDDGNPGLEQPLIATNVTTGQGIKKRSVGWTTSQSYLAGQYSENGQLVGNDYGIASEVRATLLPITLFTGGAEGQAETTIEVLGPWRLVANAGGIDNTGWIRFGPDFGPGAEEPNTPVLRISSRTTQAGVVVEEYNDVITVEDLKELLGGQRDEGLRIEVPGILSIVLGEAPRAIGDESETSEPTETPTRVSAAADVLRIEVLESAEPQGSEVAEIRLGHMEVEAEVPRGGLACVPPPPPPLPPTGIDEGGQFKGLPLPELENGVAVPGAGEAVQAVGHDNVSGQESLRAVPAARQQPILRALGVFSAAIAIAIASGAMLLRRRRWAGS
ncbi:MAG: hypothetical protein ABR592_13725 [Nitriliruptorales bacterium]